MVGNNYDLQTDTHLSKDYNKVLQSCMIVCNNAKYGVESTPHYELLIAYYGAIHTFFNNTFFLFENILKGKESYSIHLMNEMDYVRKKVNSMKLKKSEQTQQNFLHVLEKCDYIHMLIMGGLQQRKMLVRMSETEPKGAKSIEHWGKKAQFNKKGLEIKEVDGKRTI